VELDLGSVVGKETQLPCLQRLVTASHLDAYEPNISLGRLRAAAPPVSI